MKQVNIRTERRVKLAVAIIATSAGLLWAPAVQGAGLLAAALAVTIGIYYALDVRELGRNAHHQGPVDRLATRVVADLERRFGGRHGLRPGGVAVATLALTNGQPARHRAEGAHTYRGPRQSIPREYRHRTHAHRKI